ncbi:MAG: porin family protein, partial [Acidobacteriota bacterium]|nr:porin family protein [Acidobacteriota bacterium]
NKAVAASSKNNSNDSKNFNDNKVGDATPSTEVLQAQLKAQQKELDAMKERVQKLESMLTAVISSSKSTATTENAQVVRETETDPNKPMPISEYYSPARIKARRDSDTPRELLPDIGQIGAEVNLLVGGAQNPYRSKAGFFAGGSINLPLKRVPGGKLSYEIMVTLQKSKTDVQVTSPVFALVNSALNRELGNPPSVNNLFGPLPVTHTAEERSTVLTVVPAALKYTVTSLDRNRIRPYVVVGLGTYVSLSTQNLKDFNASRFVAIPSVANLLNTLLQGPLVGGLAPAAPELRERGIGQGQGDVRFGVNFGGGVEFRITSRTSFGVDYRVNKIEGRNSTYSTLAFKQGFHF